MFQLRPDEQYVYLHKLEIDITESCNLSCKSCVRGCDKFKSNRMMNVDSITRFVNESIDLNYNWSRIGIMGGEPTIHPNLDQIIDELYRYHEFNPTCHFWTRSNGIVKYNFPSWVEYQLNEDHSYHHAFYISPIDVGYPMDKRTCHVLYDCGLMYSVNGYMPCCNSNVHVRALNLFDGVQSLKNVSYESMMRLCKMYCKHCGWYMMDDFDHGELLNYPSTSMSPTWADAKTRYDLHNNYI